MDLMAGGNRDYAANARPIVRRQIRHRVAFGHPEGIAAEAAYLDPQHYGEDEEDELPLRAVVEAVEGDCALFRELMDETEVAELAQQLDELRRCHDGAGLYETAANVGSKAARQRLLPLLEAAAEAEEAARDYRLRLVLPDHSIERGSHGLQLHATGQRAR